MLGMRIDKWLWAARFFKTRSLAKSAIETGKIKMDGQKVKPSRNIYTEQIVCIRQGFDEKTVVVIGLSDQRRSASEAQLLYAETEESARAREKLSMERRLAHSPATSSSRPTKKQRRKIHQFLES